ncbi:MAG: 50S ribosomal protein L25/general stress protein Ctc [Pseudomonadota bacterium]
MSVSFTVDAEPRTDQGKGASRRLRRANQVPAVVYGAGKEPESIMVKHNEVLKSLDHEAFYSHILTLNVGKKSQQVILRDIQRHPFKKLVMHIDFLRVQSDQSIQVQVPLHFLNEENCVGVKQGGGIISHLETEILIDCLPGDLPEYIEIDVAALELGASLHLSDVKLPEGVTSVDLAYGEDHDRAVVSIHVTRASKSDDDDDDAGEEAAEGEEDTDG